MASVEVDMSGAWQRKRWRMPSVVEAEHRCRRKRTVAVERDVSMNSWIEEDESRERSGNVTRAEISGPIIVQSNYVHRPPLYVHATPKRNPEHPAHPKACSSPWIP